MKVYIPGGLFTCIGIAILLIFHSDTALLIGWILIIAGIMGFHISW